MNASVSVAPETTTIPAGPGEGSTRILIVEDDPITARYLELGLKRMGYAQVRVASSSEQAIEMAQAEPQALVLMDIQIDGAHDGIDTARVLRDRFDVPVIFLTGLADESTMERARELDPLGYLVKPVKAEDLRAALAAGLQKERLARAIRERECWFNGVLEAQGEAVFAFNRAGYIEFANSAARQLLGLPPGELPSQRLTDLASLYDTQANSLSDPLAITPGEFPALLLRAGVSCSVRINLRRVLDVREQLLGVVMVMRIVDDRSQLDAELRRLRAELAARTLSDDLTGLYNRRGFIVMGEQHLKLVRRGRSAINVLFVAARCLKRINDGFGSEAGVQALKDLGGVLRESVRESDLLCHLGGGEFALLANTPDASELIARINANIESHNAAAGRAWLLEVGIGTTIHQPKDTRRMPELLDAASRASRKGPSI